MWESLSQPWQVCFEQAWAAYCAGSVPVGSIVTDSTGRILSRGRNRIFENEGGDGYLYGQTLAHAELNALITLDTRFIDHHTYMLYTTTEPCPLCLGALYMSSVRELHYACRDPYAGSVNLLGKTPYLKRKPIKVFNPEREDFEIVIMCLSAEFDLSKKGELPNMLLDTWETITPRGVALGRQLYHSGELRRMKGTRSTAAEVLNRLGEMV